MTNEYSYVLGQSPLSQCCLPLYGQRVLPSTPGGRAPRKKCSWSGPGVIGQFREGCKNRTSCSPIYQIKRSELQGRARRGRSVISCGEARTCVTRGSSRHDLGTASHRLGHTMTQVIPSAILMLGKIISAGTGSTQLIGPQSKNDQLVPVGKNSVLC